MKQKKILALDQGTTGSTAMLMNLKGESLGSVNVPFKQIFSQASWVEHNPTDIIRSMRKAIKTVLEKTKTHPQEILSVGITNQRETVVFWDRRTGKTIGNAIVWQCRRTSKRTEKLKVHPDAQTIYQKTGLGIDPYFSSTKIEWFLKRASAAIKKNLCVGTVDSFLLYKLSGGQSFYTEPSNASRTQLYNIKKQAWDPELLKFFSVPQHVLPDILDSNAQFGCVKGFSPLVDGTPITGILGDQQSALFGQGALSSGQVKCTFGTGSFILLNTGTKVIRSKNNLLSTVAWKLKGKKMFYALEGGAFNCASCINWFRDTMGVIKKSSDIGASASEVADSLGVKFAPTFSGMGAPYWKPEVRGAFIGLTRGTKGGHLSRALLEGLAFQNRLIFKSMERDYKKKLKSIYVDGGASQSDIFMEIQAKFAEQRLIRPQNIETTALGAAMIAGSGVGAFDLSKKSLNPIDQDFKCRLSVEDQKHLKAYEDFFKVLAERL